MSVFRYLPRLSSARCNHRRREGRSRWSPRSRSRCCTQSLDSKILYDEKHILVSKLFVKPEVQPCATAAMAAMEKAARKTSLFIFALLRVVVVVAVAAVVS